MAARRSYWCAQLLGALVAAALLRGSLGNIADVGATLPSGSQGQSFLWEFVMSAFLMFVILAVATDTRAVGEAAAIAIGGTIAPRRDVRRTDLRRLDEPGSLDRPGVRLRQSPRPLALHRRADPRDVASVASRISSCAASTRREDEA